MVAPDMLAIFGADAGRMHAGAIYACHMWCRCPGHVRRPNMVEIPYLVRRDGTHDTIFGSNTKFGGGHAWQCPPCVLRSFAWPARPTL